MSAPLPLARAARLLRHAPAVALLAAALAAPAAAQVEVVLPRPGTTLNRVHAQFRWPAFPALVSDYELQVVEDDGSANPFVGGFPIRFHDVPAAEPRTVVESGLEFGKPYAWRVLAFVGNPPARTVSAVYRFEVAPLPPEVPPMVVTVPPGAVPVEPGVVMLNHTGLTGPHTGGALLTVDAAGRVLHFLNPAPRFGDLRQLRDGHRDGRLLWVRPSPVMLGGGGRAFETTLDGGIVWASPDVTLPGGADAYSVHHEVFPMPDGDYLALVQDDRTLIIAGQPRDYAGDRIVQFDHHTSEVVWTWSTFDDYSLRDFHPNIGPSDWTHGNAVVFDDATGRIYTSMRSISRISCLDYASGALLYNMGEQDWPGMDVAFGDNLFSFQHAPQPLPGGNLLIYDNGNEREPLTDPRQSRAIELAFDDPLQPTAASIVWEYRLEDDQGQPLFTAFVGDADRLPGGHTLVTAGRAAIVDEVDAQGNLIWRLTLDVGFPTNLLYRAEKVPALVVDLPGDTDGDQDLDLADLAGLQVGFTGPGPAALPFPERLSDHDGDDDLDAADVVAFVSWGTGPAR